MSADDPKDRPEPAGERADWEVLESSADLDSSTVRALRDLERIAAFNRDLQRTGTVKEDASKGSEGQPKSWGHLMLLERVGAGAQGEVWRAWDATLQRQVALKFLQAEGTLAVSSDLVAEARALARVRHPGVVAVYGVAEHDGRTGMWMEWIEGLTLAREIERRGTLPGREVARIGVELCAALEALEGAGVVHRDVKPANIVLETGGRVVLTDFGLGWRPALDDTKARASGTPLFMAPEILGGGEPSPQSDLYALGVTLWWALVGRAPFQSKTVHDLRKEAARGPALSLRDARQGTSDALVDAIEWAMKPQESDRPRSAAQLRRRLAAEVSPLTAASIAVLPFENRSGDKEGEYFSDGLADELLGVLAKVQGVRVAARTSSFRFRGAAEDIAAIGRKLGVTTLLEGSVRTSGDRVRISVHLVKASDGFSMWSRTYDHLLGDVFSVQEDIARSVVNELRSTLTGQKENPDDLRAEIAMAARGGSSNAGAYALYLKGRYFLNRAAHEDQQRGMALLEKAVEADPGFALAWAELARGYVTLRNLGWGGGYDLGRKAAQRALEIEPDLAEGHSVLGWIQQIVDWDWEAAERSIGRAMELAPGSAFVLRRAAVLAWTQARVEEAIALNQEAVTQDPLDPVPLYNLGLALHAAGRLGEAEDAYRRAIELEPSRIFTHASLALVLLDEGKGDEAWREAARDTGEHPRLFSLAVIQEARGERHEAAHLLRQLEEKYPGKMPFQIAEAHALRGDHDQAFQWLERAYAARDTMICDLKVSRRLRALHGDPRWPDLLRRVWGTR